MTHRHTAPAIKMPAFSLSPAHIPHGYRCGGGCSARGATATKGPGGVMVMCSAGHWRIATMMATAGHVKARASA